MADIKFGLDQMGSPAPKKWRQFERAYIIMFAPGLTGLFASWGFKDATTNKILLAITFSMAIVKGIGMLLGNGQEYVTKEETKN